MHSPADPNSTSVALAGASGFIGRGLVAKLLEETPHNVVALSRCGKFDPHPRLEMRAVDFFSLAQAEASLRGCDVAIYLLHSMVPSNRLSQGRFEDFDFILADNFARAARGAGVKHIIYVGGMIGDTSGELSRHLKSRLEVEHVLAASGIPLTALRCSLIIGASGSSFIILKKLVQRLPTMLLPAWCMTPCQPVSLKDVLKALVALINQNPVACHSYDLGAPGSLTYRRLIELAVENAGLKRKLIDVPAVPLALSKLWVRVVTGASRSLVYPLVDSLAHPMTVRPGHEIPSELVTSFEPIPLALTNAMQAQSPQRVRLTSLPRRNVRQGNLVKSVQRLVLPHKLDAYTVAGLYFKWLSRFFNGLIDVRLHDRTARFHIALMSRPLLELTYSPDRSARDRQLYYITGGLLARKQERARLEFRESPLGDAVFAAIHDFRPALPWWLYRMTQAPFHWFVMWSFGRFLQSIHMRNMRQSTAVNRSPENPTKTSGPVGTEHRETI